MSRVITDCMLRKSPELKAEITRTRIGIIGAVWHYSLGLIDFIEWYFCENGLVAIRMNYSRYCMTYYIKQDLICCNIDDGCTGLIKTVYNATHSRPMGNLPTRAEIVYLLEHGEDV